MLGWSPDHWEREPRLWRQRVRFFFGKQTTVQLALEIGLGIIAFGVLGAVLYYMFAG
jgi:hypothetical protein